MKIYLLIALSFGLASSLTFPHQAQAKSSAETKKNCLSGKSKVDGTQSEPVDTGISLDGTAGKIKVSGSGTICAHKNCKNGKGETIKFSPPKGLEFSVDGSKVSLGDTQGKSGSLKVRFVDSNYTDNSGSYQIRVEWCPK